MFYCASKGKGEKEVEEVGYVEKVAFIHVEYGSTGYFGSNVPKGVYRLC